MSNIDTREIVVRITKGTGGTRKPQLQQHFENQKSSNSKKQDKRKLRVPDYNKVMTIIARLSILAEKLNGSGPITV